MPARDEGVVTRSCEADGAFFAGLDLAHFLIPTDLDIGHASGCIQARPVDVLDEKLDLVVSLVEHLCQLRLRVVRPSRLKR